MTNVHTKPMTYKLTKQACIATGGSTNIMGTNCRFSNVCGSALFQNGLKNEEILPALQFKNRIADLLSKVKIRNMKGKLLVLALLILAFNYLYAGKSSRSLNNQIRPINNEIIHEEASLISPLVIVDKYMLQ